MTFVREADFEEAVIQMLKDHGWEDAVLLDCACLFSKRNTNTTSNIAKA